MSSTENSRDRDRLLAAIEVALADGWTEWPGGYPEQVELALIDAVFSIRARYGAPDSGVRRVVDNWSRVRREPANDLQAIVDLDGERFSEILENASITAGRTKASAVQDAAVALVAIGIRSAEDFRDNAAAAKSAYTGVHGLGWVTFSYLCMLLGMPDAKADVWIVRFVSRALNRAVDGGVAHRLVQACAAELFARNDQSLPTDATALDHALWSYERQVEHGETLDDAGG